LLGKRSVILNAEKALKALHEYDCKLLVRVDGFTLVGIISKIKKEYDSQMGKDRKWAVGITMDGEIFEEPIDRKNPKKGGLEDIIQRDTPFMMVTARNSSDPDDSDKNFSWLPNKFSMSRMKAIEDENIAQIRILNSMKDEFDSQMKKMKRLRMASQIAEEENQNLEHTVFELSQRTSRIERENQELYTLLQRLRGKGLEVEGELAVELKRALQRGREKAMTPHEIRITKLQEDEKEKQMVMRSQPDSDKISKEDIRDVIQDELSKERKRNDASKTPAPATKKE